MLISVPRSNLCYPSFCCCSPMSLKLLLSWVMSLLNGTRASGAGLSCVFVIHSFCKVCISCAACAAERDCWARVDTRNVFGAMDYCVLLSLVYAGFLVLGEQRVLLAVGTCRARPLNTRAIHKWKQGWSGQASEVLLCRAKDRVGQRCSGHAPFGVFFQAQALRPVQPSQHLDPSRPHFQCPPLFQWDHKTGRPSGMYGGGDVNCSQQVHCGIYLRYGKQAPRAQLF